MVGVYRALVGVVLTCSTRLASEASRLPIAPLVDPTAEDPELIAAGLITPPPSNHPSWYQKVDAREEHSHFDHSDIQ